VHSIFIKTGVTSRTAAVRYALEHNLAAGDKESS
jgi:DNA-binding NarL/FixJ family response regulator